MNMKMTCNEVWTKIDDTDTIVDMIFYLHQRWLDEGEYEDINEYLKVVRQHIPMAMTMYRRPFGFSIVCADGILKISVKKDGGGWRLYGTSSKR